MKALIHMMQRRVEIMLLETVDDYFHYGTPGLRPALRPWRMPDWPEARNWGQRRGAQAVANRPERNVLTPAHEWTDPTGVRRRRHSRICAGSARVR